MSLSSVVRSTPSQVVSPRTAAVLCSRSSPSCTSAGPARSRRQVPPSSQAPKVSRKAVARPSFLAHSLVPQHGYQIITPLWFNSTIPRLKKPSGPKPPDRDPGAERKVQLGETLRVLQPRLPTLLQSPLPQDILAPNISLHLFPSTHPYLPVVSGRVAYIAALWTSPIAWNRVPIIGNLQLEILSARMTSQPVSYAPAREGAYPEQLVVKWRTADKAKNGSTGQSLAEQGEQNLDDILRGTQSVGSKKEFTGLFVFEFDQDGKVLSHTIEHVDQSGEWERGIGAKVVHLTDWLLGGIKGGRSSPGGALPLFQATNDRRGGQVQ
jgi:hypothetical protein